MKWSYRLKRWVAPGLRAIAGWRRPRPDTGKRLNGQSPSVPSRPPAPTPMRELIDLAWPIAAGMLGETALGLVDTKLVGGLGPGALADCKAHVAHGASPLEVEIEDAFNRLARWLDLPEVVEGVQAFANNRSPAWFQRYRRDRGA